MLQAGLYDTLIRTPVLSSLGSSFLSALPISSPPSVYTSSTTSPSPLMSSPFHPSHRRTRSHSSLSTPCTSPGPQQIQWRSPAHRAHACPKAIPCNVHGVSAPWTSAKGALDLSSQPPEKWDVDRWRRGKRARREPESPSGDADMESGDEALAGLSSPDQDRSIVDPACPGSVGLASTSDAFQFFTTRTKPSARPRTVPQRLSDDEIMEGMQFSPQTDGLAHLQAAAFDDLRKSVEEAGEGFVRRMREFEAQRSVAGPSVSISASQRAFHKRGRKRPSPRASRHFAFPPASAEDVASGNREDEEESDVEILSSIASSSDDYPHSSPTKKRAVSLCALNDIPYALQPQCMSSPVRPSGVGFGRERSPSPMEDHRGPSMVYSNCNSSDEDDELQFNAQRPRRARKVLRPRYSCDASSAESNAPSLSFSFASNNSSLQSLPLGAPTPTGRPSFPTNEGDVCNYPLFRNVHRNRPTVPEKSSKYTEKAVAALSLALANGAGSVTDYDALQSACGAFPSNDGDAGSLWN